MKKILFVTYDFPYPTNTGGKNRAYHMLKYAGSDFKKYLFSFVRPDFEEENTRELEKIGVEVVGTTIRRSVRDVRNGMGLIGNGSIFKSLYYSKRVAKEISEIIKNNEIDVVHFESFYTGFYISDSLKKLGVKQVYGSENIEYKMYEDYSKDSPKLLKPLYNMQVKKIRKEEIRMAQNSDVCIAVSDSDAEEFKKYNKCQVVRNGVDIGSFPFKKSKKKASNILFVGNFSYFPNIEAINFFYNDVFKNMTGDIKLIIVGKKVADLGLDDDRLEKIDFIPDIYDAYKQADVVVSPIKLGGGTNFKVLEAFAAGVPVVAFPDRLEGLDVTNGKNILMASDAREFKIEVERLLEDAPLRKKIADDARRLVEKEYSWEAIGKKLGQVWNGL